MILVFAAAVGAAILFSALLTAAEAAVFAPSDSRVRTLAEQGVRGSGALAQLREHPERVLLLLRFGDALADVTAGALVGWGAYMQLHGVPLAIALGLLAFIVLYFGELLPLGLARTHAPHFALAIAPALLVATRVLGPALDAAARIARVEPRAREVGGGITETDIRHLTVLGHTEGGIEEHERALIERAFRMDETKAWDIMTPRVDIFAWPDDRLLRELVTELASVPYSRVPVFRDTIDNITGVLYVRDAHQALVAGQRDVPIRSLAREPLIVPGSMPLNKLLRDFQTRRIHLAIVVDEYGGTDGLVTLEDVLEELVGEIVDETDIAEDPIMRVSRAEIIASGDVDLREINHYLNASFPQLEHRTLNGYLLDELGRVPERGERFEREGIHIEIVDATDTLVERVRLRRLASSGDGSAPVAPGPDARAGAAGEPAAADGS